MLKNWNIRGMVVQLKDTNYSCELDLQQQSMWNRVVKRIVSWYLTTVVRSVDKMSDQERKPPGGVRKVYVTEEATQESL